MAPEQAEGELVGEPADTYSLGLTLYEMWAGANPVARETPAHTAREIGRPLPSLSRLSAGPPARAHRLRRRMPRPEPGSRPPLDELHRRLVAASLARRQRQAVPDRGYERAGDGAGCAAGRPARGAYRWGWP